MACAARALRVTRRPTIALHSTPGVRSVCIFDVIGPARVSTDVGRNDMKPAFVIPTDHKAKIPHTFSYTVGAERISEALQDVPQITDLCVSFPYSQTSSGDQDLIAAA